MLSFITMIIIPLMILLYYNWFVAYYFIKDNVSPEPMLHGLVILTPLFLYTSILLLHNKLPQLLMA